MFQTSFKLRFSLLVLALALVTSAPVFAGSAIVGSVAGSINTTVRGQMVLPNSTIFSGDSLRVQDGAAVVALGKGSRMVFGRYTVASFLRDSDEVTVLLNQGNVSMFHPTESVAVRVKVGELTVTPTKGFNTVGDIAMADGAVQIIAKEGSLRVEGNGPAVEVTKGKTLRVATKAARTPQGQAGGATGAARAAGTAGTGVTTGLTTGLQVGSLAGGVTSSVMSSVAMSRSSDATNLANQANTSAGEAVTAANNATDAANAATTTAVGAGCALNIISHEVNPTGPSPFTPPPGATCD